MGRLFGSYWTSYMKTVSRDNLDCLATIYRIPDGTDPGDVDGSGNVLTDPVLLATDVPCRINRAGESQPVEGITADQLLANARWIVTFEVGERRVKSQHLLVVSGSTDCVPWERRLSVIRALDPVSDEVMVQVLCDEA